MKKMLALPLLGLSLLIATPVLADSHHKHHHDGCQYNFEHMTHKLHLNATQKKEFEAIMKDKKDKIMALHSEIDSSRKAYQDVVFSDKLDEKKLDALIDSKSALAKKMLKIHVMAKQKMYSLLDAKQKAKFVEMSDKHYKNMVKHRCHMM